MVQLLRKKKKVTFLTGNDKFCLRKASLSVNRFQGQIFKTAGSEKNNIKWVKVQ